MAQNTQNNILIFGASSGIGLATAQLALTHLPNPNLILSSSSQENLNQAASAIASAKPPSSLLTTIPTDLSDIKTQFDAVETTLQLAVEKFGAPIDHIVWTAGAVGSTPATERSHDDLIAQQTIRIFGPLTLHSLAKKYMRASARSSITITSGVLNWKPMAGATKMSAVSGAVESAVRAMAVELAPIRVNGVVPGVIQTPLLDRVAARAPGLKALWTEKTLVKAIGAAEEAAEAYLYCMRCGFVTGSMIPVDGGYFLAA